MEPNLGGGGRGWVTPVVVGGVVGTVLGVGIWFAVGAGDGDVRANSGDPTPNSTTTAVPEVPGSLTGTWSGTYDCGEGARELVLTVIDSGGELDAVFEFGGPEDLPAGAFTMRGTVDDDGGVQLEGEDWIDRPDEYLQVDLEGDAAGREIVGRPEGEGCRGFRVERTSTDPWYLGSWTGTYDCSQGLTGLTLTVEADGPAGEGAVTARFDLHAVPENPDVPSGSYTMKGRYVDGVLSLQGAEWIAEPDDYEMVGLETDPETPTRPDRLVGRVTDPECERFELERAR